MERKLTNRQKQAIQTKARIYDCAFALFKENNYEDVTINLICETAQVSVGNFYHYYSSKDELLLSSYPMFDKFVEEDLAQKEYPCYIDGIRDLIYHQAYGYKAYMPSILGQILRLQLSKDKYVIKESRFFHKYLKHLVEQALEAGELHPSYQSDEIVETILRISRGVLFDWVLRNGIYAPEEKAMHDLNHILKAFQMPMEM